MNTNSMRNKIIFNIQVQTRHSGIQGSIDFGEFLHSYPNSDLEFQINSQISFDGKYVIENIIKNGKRLTVKQILQWYISLPFNIRLTEALYVSD